MPDGKPLRISFNIQPDMLPSQESLYKGPCIINGYTEKLPSGTYAVYKRPGFIYHSEPEAYGRGLYNWNGSTLIGVFGDSFYSDVLTGTSAALVLSTDDTALYSFVTSITSTTTVFFHNAVAGYQYNSGTGIVTQVTDVDYPASTVYGAVWLDGTYYVMDSSAYIYGSDLNNPLSWNSLNKIQAQIEPDAGIALARQLSYVIAFKQYSTEVFYNAGNATGSPLARQTGSKLNYGCLNARTLQDINGTLYWVSLTKAGTVSVVCMNNLTVENISNDYVDKVVSGSGGVSTNLYSFIQVIPGHTFYCISSDTFGVTLAYDIDLKYWYIWTWYNGVLPFYSSAVLFSGNTVLTYYQSYPGTLYSTSLITGTDFSGASTQKAIDFSIVTPIFDGQTRRRKYLKILDVICDRPINSGTKTYAKAYLNVRYTQDGYKTWSNYRQIDLSLDKTRLTNCGTFVKRAYHFQYNAPLPFRIEAMEMQIEEGTL